MLKELLEVNKKKSQLFQVLFLKNNGDQSVEVDEVEQIDFTKVEERLKRGDTVFITNKQTQKFLIPKLEKKANQRSVKSENSSKVPRKTAKGKGYFDHV